MTRTVVDTSALLALLYPDDEHNRQAADHLREAAERGALLIDSVVYAELAADPYFGSSEALEAFLDDIGAVLEDLPPRALFDAGEAFGTYLDRRDEELQCSKCGHRDVYHCPECDGRIETRQHVAADFLIGAHAETAGALLTFDAGFYSEYFDVEVRAFRGA